MQLQIKIILGFVFFFSIFICSFVSGAEFGVYPSAFELNLNLSVTECHEVFIMSGFPGKLVVKDYWRKNGFSNKIDDYQLSGEEIGIDSFYFEDIIQKGENEIQVCFKAKNEGHYNGVLLFSVPEKRVGIGVWTKINVLGDELSLKKLIESNVVGDSNLILLLMFETGFLGFLTLFFLFIVIKKKPKL